MMEKIRDVDAGGFFAGYSLENHAGSKLVGLTIIAATASSCDRHKQRMGE